MYQSPVSAYILKMKKPVLARRGVYPCSLVRTVDGAVALCQYFLPFVRAIYVLGTEHNLPPGRHAACRMEYIVIVSSFVEFRPFTCLMRFMPVEDDARLCDGFGGIRTQFANGNDAFQSGTTSCIGVYHIYFSVFIPKRASVYNSLTRLNEYGFCPRTFRIFGFYHESALVGIPPEYVEFTVMITDSRSPYAVTMFRTFGRFDRSKGIRHGGADDAPAY